MKTNEQGRGFAPIFLALAIVASILTLISLTSYLFAEDDYDSPRCNPVNTYPACINDLNQMTFSEASAGIGFLLIGLGTYLSRRIQPALYFFIIAILMLGLYALYSFLG